MSGGANFYTQSLSLTNQLMKSFTAVCFEYAILSGEMKQPDAKTVSGSGKIKDRNDRIEIILERAHQILE